MINAINEGKLENAETNKFKYFNLEIPKRIPGVDEKLLNPSENWNNKQEYGQKLKNLATKIAENYNKNFKGKINAEVDQYVPKL